MCPMQVRAYFRVSYGCPVGCPTCPRTDKVRTNQDSQNTTKGQAKTPRDLLRTGRTLGQARLHEMMEGRAAFYMLTIPA